MQLKWLVPTTPHKSIHKAKVEPALSKRANAKVYIFFYKLGKGCQGMSKFTLEV
jgi:hypothetical protein